MNFDLTLLLYTKIKMYHRSRCKTIKHEEIIHRRKSSWPRVRPRVLRHGANIVTNKREKKMMISGSIHYLRVSGGGGGEGSQIYGDAKKMLIIPNSGEDVEQWEPSYVFGENIKWSAKQLGSSLQRSVYISHILEILLGICPRERKPTLIQKPAHKCL